MFRFSHITLTLILISFAFTLNAKVIHVEYYDNGQKKIELIKMKKGIVQINEYFVSGQLKEQGYSKNGMFQGKWIRFNETGTIIATAFYHNNVKIGSWNHYDQWSQNTFKVYYHNGVATAYKQFGPNGDLIASGERID
jgi:antitoxin component YwqK of YwqJK toxin-antitoxin module